MRQSHLFTRTQKRTPRDEGSTNAKLLTRAGFIHKETAGVYSFLPLGWRVLDAIEHIVREEMDRVGGQEILMPALHAKENWVQTGRWESFDALFKLKSRSETEYALGPTHEEILYPLLTHFIASYRDLPIAIYQIQTKFRDEPRAKSGLLRGREFRMKDLYSFHAGEEDRNQYYEVMRKAYGKIFERIGLDAIETKASGGTFSDVSLEFQVLCEAGEDSILLCRECQYAVNEELAKNKECERCEKPAERRKAVEVGNIFPLKDQYSRDFRLTYKDASGKEKLVAAGCYGLGISRVMGVLAEVFHDEKGLLWPSSVAPFQVHLIGLPGVETESDTLYKELSEQKGIAVLYDDRKEVQAGEKFADADLLGFPWRLILSKKTFAQGNVELKERKTGRIQLVKKQELPTFLSRIFL